MITAGIDAGLEYTKAVVMKDGVVAGKASGHSGGVNRPAAIEQIYNEALEAAAVKAGDVARVFATGKGKYDVSFADDKIAEVIAAAKSAKLQISEATTVIDAGADEIVVATLDGDKVHEFVQNQKCAAGLGLLLEGIAERFELSIEEINMLEGLPEVSVNDGCVVFAELDALSLLNRGVDVKEIAKAIVEACAWRASTTINDIYRPDKNCVVLMGGLALNGAFVRALERISGIKFVIHDDPVYGAAIGVAALAVL